MSIQKPSDSTPLLPPKGIYAPPKPTDLRSPCPAVNICANHGYISRDGRNIRSGDLYAALDNFGLGSLVAAGFAYAIYAELPSSPDSEPKSWYSVLTDPFNWAFEDFALRPKGQKDKEGCPVINLDQLARPNVIEHDISLSRLDHQQGDNISKQTDLIKQILAASSDGKTLDFHDLARVRKARIQQQRLTNPSNSYDSSQHRIACAEISLILKIFGDGTRVPVSYVKAFFEDERLPKEEGWAKRSWWNYLGLIELSRCVMKIGNTIGDYNEKVLPPMARTGDA